MSTRRKFPKKKPSPPSAHGLVAMGYDELPDPPPRSPRPAMYGLSGPLAWLYDDLVAAAARHPHAGAIDVEGREAVREVTTGSG